MRLEVHSSSFLTLSRVIDSVLTSKTDCLVEHRGARVCHSPLDVGRMRVPQNTAVIGNCITSSKAQNLGPISDKVTSDKARRYQVFVSEKGDDIYKQSKFFGGVGVQKCIDNATG